ncbi:MAG: PAS domain S-box protein [Deltaproteobacteria bacterium]|nr:PAS domain S-box protein [Deltaproteobacteria bacterium]
MGTQLHVLVVDDSEDDALLVLRELRRAGYECAFRRVETAEAMDAALEEEHWDVVISDYSMPRFSGPAALALLQDKGLDLPFLMVSRVIGEETAVEALRAGAHDFVMKGNLARLAPAVGRELREAQGRRERRQAAEALRASEERFRELADLLPETVFEAGNDGLLSFINRRGLDLFGYSLDEVRAGLPVLQLIAVEERPRAQANVDSILGGTRGAATQYTAIRKDRTTFPVLVHSSAILRNGRAVGMRGIAVDLTPLRRAEQERSRLATAVEQAAEAIVIAGTRGEIEYANPAFEAVTGYSLEEVRGRSLVFLNRGTAEPAALRAVAECLEAGRPWSGHLAGKKKDGELLEEDCTLSPVRDETSRLVNFVAVRRDVTQQLRMERLFRQAQKLDALGTLAGGIAHDFKNLLMPIIGFTQLTYDDLPEGSDGRDNLGRVLSAADRARDLIDRILAFSREAEQPKQPVRLGPMVRETLELLRASLPSTVEIRHRLETADDAVLADPTRIHQVLVNLCTNAGQAMEGRPGVLEVTLAEVTPDAGFLARNPDLKEGPYLRLSVNDTGCGMTKDLTERIFDPFFTTRAEHGGTGLGLAAVHGIVTSFGGVVRVYSEPGYGTSFHVYLPRIGVAEAEPAGPESTVPTGSERILYVDDDADIAELGRKTLEALGYEVAIETGSLEALERFRADPEAFDLVVTDDIMPKMTGVAMAREMRRLRPGVPILLTGGLVRTAREEVEQLGLADVLPKPATTRQIGEAVRRALDRAGGRSPPGPQELRGLPP